MNDFQDVAELLLQCDKLYERLASMNLASRALLTKKYIYEQRGWLPSQFIIERAFDEQLKRIGMFYIPKVMQPGPCFVCPLRDSTGEVRRVQTRPMPGSVLYSSDKKYYMLGDKDLFLGPSWLGNDPLTIAQILERRAVYIVEGAFDLLACRLVVPPTRPDSLPSLCPLGKTLGKKHILFLKMLGVRTLYLLMDHETSGVGDKSMKFMEEDLKDFEVHIVEQTGGGEDPSSALKNLSSARRLYNVIHQLDGVPVEDSIT